MHDGLEIERRGKPAAVICSDKFIVTAKAQAETSGLPDYPFMTVVHPIGRLTDDELRERAAVAAEQAIRLLVSKR